MNHRQPEQLNNAQFPAESEPEYTLEDIMNEFGGWTKRGPRQAAPVHAQPGVCALHGV